MDNCHSFIYMLQCYNGPMKTINAIAQVTKSFRLAFCVAKLVDQVEMEKASVKRKTEFCR